MPFSLKPTTAKLVNAKLVNMMQSASISSGLGLVAIAVAAGLWAVAGIVASELFQAGVKPFELAVARAVIAAVGLAAMQSVGRQISRRQPSRRQPLKRVRTDRFDWRILALGVSLALVTVTYYVAISRLSVAVAIVIQYMAPALVVALTAFRTRRLPTLTMLLAVMATMFGVLLVSGLIDAQLGLDGMGLDGMGLVAAGFSALFFASSTVLSEAVVNTYGAIGVMFRAFAVSSLFWIAFQLSQGFPDAVFLPANLPGILFVGIGGTLIPFSLACWGIQQVRAERGVVAATLEPVIAAVLAWIWLGQSLTLMQLVGGGLILAAVVSLQMSAMRPIQPSINPKSKL